MVVPGFELGGRDVTAGTVQAPVVEPVDPLEGGDLQVVDAPPVAAGADGGPIAAAAVLAYALARLATATAATSAR